jgi:hypothetical protein
VPASPLYWYAMSTSTKRYLDHWSGWMRVPGADFKERRAGRTLWGVTALATADPSVTEPATGTLRTIASYMRMEWGGMLLGLGNRPDDVLNDTAAAIRAKTFFGRPGEPAVSCRARSGTAAPGTRPPARLPGSPVAIARCGAGSSAM